MSLIRDATAGMQYLGANEPVLHVGGETGDRPARDARRREALSPVAGHLKDRPQAVRESSRDGHRTPGFPRSSSPRDNRRVPAAVTGIVLGRLVVPEVIANMRTSVPGPKSASDVALADAIDVRLVPIVAADRNALAEVGRRADLAKEMVSSELAVGVAGEPAARAGRAERRRRSRV